jgi:hypothetical protein
MMWQLDLALRVVRVLQSQTRQFGYHLTLGGGVLNKGESQKDLDLYFLPMGGFDGKKKHDPDAMLKYLESLWGASKPLAQNGGYEYEETSKFYKHAVQFTRWGGAKRDVPQRVDCFIF